MYVSLRILLRLLDCPVLLFYGVSLYINQIFIGISRVSLLDVLMILTSSMGSNNAGAAQFIIAS